MPTTVLHPCLLPKYRPDIDGLRAVAVLSVICYHAFPSSVKAGFIGVDIFFTISGYLISLILFERLDHGTFRFSEFYVRRIRRIFPALLVVLIACSVLGWFTLLAQEYKQLGKHIAGGAGFISNFLFWMESGYFDPSADTKPLLHLWSLAIEEQFYAIWPLVLWTASRHRVNLLIITGAVAGLSFAFNLVLYGDGTADFYSPQTRFWELMAGSVLAYATIRNWAILITLKRLFNRHLAGLTSRQVTVTPALSDLQSLLGALILTIGLVLITSQDKFPGAWAILPVVGTLVIIDAGKNAWLNRVVLSTPLLVWLGLISYPLYLWHWPLLSFARILDGQPPPNIVRVAALSLSMGLAWFTYAVVERYIRFGTKGAGKALILAMSMVMVGCMGYNIYANDGLRYRSAETQHQLISAAIADWKYPNGLTQVDIDGVTVYTNSADPPRVIMFGDSHVEQFGPRLANLSTAGSVRSTMLLTRGGCAPIPFVYEEHDPLCSMHVANLRTVLARMPQIDTLVIGACWNCYFISQAQALAAGEVSKFNYYYSRAGARYDFRGDAGGVKLALESLRKFLTEMTRKYDVYLLLDNPVGNFFAPQLMMNRRLANWSGGLTLNARVDPNQLALNEKLRLMAQALGIKTIDQLSHLCPGNVCIRTDDVGAPIYYDWDHLRASYVVKAASYIDVVWTAVGRPANESDNVLISVGTRSSNSVGTR